MIYLTSEQFRITKDAMVNNGIPFELFMNNNSQKIKGGIGTEPFTGDILEFKHMIFIRKVKDHVKAQIKAGKLKKEKAYSKKIDYFHIGTHKNKTIKDCSEVDIDKAYWETAYKYGIINNEIYRYGMKKSMPKEIRLIALGSLAKKTTHYKFDGKLMIRQKDIVDKETEYFWNKICSHVATCMTTISAELSDNDYLFYWVDAVFIKSKALSTVKNLINEMGYNFKIKKIEKVIFSKGRITTDKKVFLIPNDNKRLIDVV
jgi:hypothetical protein